jgi:hypothetical protein
MIHAQRWLIRRMTSLSSLFFPVLLIFPISSFMLHFNWKSIEGTYHLRQVQPADMQIDGGRSGGPVAEKKLDMVETRSRFNEMGCKAVP